MPNMLTYMCYLSKYDEVATKRDLTFMKKMPRQEVMHYAKEKGFTPTDAYFALCDLDDKEITFYKNSKPILKNLHIKARESIRALLRSRHEIFEIADELDKFVMSIYNNIKPENTCRFFENFFKEISTTKLSMFDVYNIKRKSFIRDEEDEQEVYALTDSEDGF